MTEEQKALLEKITEELGGKLEYWSYADKYSTSQKIVIEYAKQKR